jgi:phosphate transport system substrate-binding protein
MRLRLAWGVVLVLAAALLAAGCGGDDEEAGGGDTAAAGSEELSGSISADGSSTVGPFTTRAAERFRQDHPDVKVTVGVSGTGGGFERFCAGETDLSDASRPIEDDEKAACEGKGIDYLELQVANDALTVVVNSGNDWATCLTTEELKKIWGPGSKVDNWNQVRSDFPDEDLSLFGPGTDSGTFDYFTDSINGEEGASRTDYSPSENDNVIVQGVGGEDGGMGYFGFTYYEENQATLKALEVDSGDGCVAPSVETAQDGSYTPLSRPLFVYVKTESLARPEVKEFVATMIDDAVAIAEEAKFVPLTDEQVEKARGDFETAATR